VKIWQTPRAFFYFVPVHYSAERCRTLKAFDQVFIQVHKGDKRQERPKATVFDISHPIKYHIQNIIRHFSGC